MKVWNVTDDPTNEVAPHARMIMGRKVAPGKSIQVDKSTLAGARKLQEEAAKGLLFIGDKLPQSYLIATGRARVKFPTRGVRTHQHKPAAPTRKPTGKGKVVVEVEEVVEVAVSAKAEIKEDSSYKRSSKRGK